MAQAAKFALNLASAVVLARLLLPADFGLVAMVTTITGFLRIFKDAGLSTATVQKEQVTHAQVSNLFWLNIFLSASIGVLVAGLAPAVAWFYHEPRLVAVTFALSCTFAIGGSVVQHQALLNRQMRYKAIAVIDIGSAVLGLVVGIAMAIMERGYWSLVGMQLATSVAELGLTLGISRWRPQRFMRRSGTRSLLHFGASLTVANILRRVAGGSDILLLGRFFGAEQVGLYSRGGALLMRPIEQVITPFETLFTPVLSRLQDDPERYRRTFLKAYNTVALFTFMFSGLFLALSKPLVLLLLGRRWESVVPIFAWMAVSALYLPLYYASMTLLNTQGRGREIMATGVNFAATTLFAAAVGVGFGPAGLALAISIIGLFIRLPIQFAIAGRQGPVSTSDLWVVLLRYLPLWSVVLATGFALDRLLSKLPPAVEILTSAPLALLAGTAIVFVIPTQRRTAAEFLTSLKRFFESVTRPANECRSN